jgi:hypothetical protein
MGTIPGQTGKCPQGKEIALRQNYQGARENVHNILIIFNIEVNE